MAVLSHIVFRRSTTQITYTKPVSQIVVTRIIPSRGGGNGNGLPAGGTVGQVVTNTAPGEGDWEDPAGGSGAVDSVNTHTGVVVLNPDDLDDTSTTHKFVTAAEKTKLANTSGTNTGDQTLGGLGGVPTTTTVNGHALSSNVTVTASDVGLGSVNNTADSAKPVSTAQAAADAAVLAAAQPLDSDLTTIAGLTATTDNIIQSAGSAWASRTPAQVKTALALNNLDNTSDANKPVSTAQAAALYAKLAPTAVKTAAYTLVANDLAIFDTTSGNITGVLLPNAPADGTLCALKMVTQGSTNTVSFATQGSDVFNKTGGATSGTLTLLGQAVLVQYKASGAIWYVLADDLPLSQLDLRYDALRTASAGTTGSVGDSTHIPVLTLVGGVVTATSTATPSVADPPTVAIIARANYK